MLHPHGRRHGAHLDFIRGLLHVEVRQDLLGESPGDHGVDRGIFDLLLGQMRRVPVALLLRLIELEIQIRLGAVGEAGRVFSQHQPTRLQRAVNRAKRDAGRLEEGQLEGSCCGR